SLIAEHHGQGVAATLELPSCVERLLAGGRAQNAVAVAVPGAKIAAHGRQDLRVIIDDEDRGFVQRGPPSQPASAGTASGSSTRNSVLPGTDSKLISPSL